MTFKIGDVVKLKGDPNVYMTVLEVKTGKTEGEIHRNDLYECGWFVGGTFHQMRFFGEALKFADDNLNVAA